MSKTSEESSDSEIDSVRPKQIEIISQSIEKSPKKNLPTQIPNETLKKKDQQQVNFSAFKNYLIDDYLIDN